MSKIFSRKQFFLIFSFSLILILFFPASPAQGQSWILQGLAFLPNLFITLILQIVLLLIQGIFALCNWLLGWAMNNPFGVSFTNPSGINSNPIIAIGWTFLRDITNMFFILGLAYIGLATSLDITDFKTKKIFGNILIIALLINFTPIICGVVVDLSNLLSKFFLEDADFTKIVNVYQNFQGGVSAAAKDFLGGTTLVRSLILILYGLLGSIVLLLFALLFLIRAPIIWILVILSPLAFFSWIFPQTKKMIWDKWWNMFLQWSIIVIPASFFLYLSQAVIAEKDALLTTTGLTDPAGGILISLAPYFVALMFMIFGFMISLQINAAGSGAIMKATHKIKGKGLDKLKIGGKKLGLGAGAEIGGGAVGGIKGLIEGGGAGFKGRMKGLAKGAFTRQGREEGREITGKALERAHLVRPGYYEEIKTKKLAGDIDEEKKRLKRLSPTRQSEILDRISNSKITTSKEKTSGAALVEMLAERNELKDTHKDAVKKFKGYGIDMNTVLKNKPGWITDFEKEADIVNFDILKEMGAGDIDRIASKGSASLKEKIGDLFDKKRIDDKFKDHIQNLKKEGKTQKAKSLEDMLNKVASKL